MDQGRGHACDSRHLSSSKSRAIAMRLRIALLCLVFMQSTAGAQDRQPPPQNSPIMDMIQRAKNSLNNLQYLQAQNTIREVLALGRLKRSQELAALEVASASFFPEDASARRPDSARVYLARLVRLMPTGPFPLDLASPGLDSQLVIARRTAFGAAVRPPLAVTLAGKESRDAVEVMSTYPARWQLYLVPSTGGAVTLLDTLAAVTNGRLALRAHDGSNAIITAGSYEFRVLAIDTARPDTISLRFDGIAVGSPPTLVDTPPPLDPSSLLPERSTRSITAGAIAGVVFGGLTWALARNARPPDALGKEPTDGRGPAVGVIIALGGITAAILDRGKAIPANIKANASIRADYLKRLGDATETNRKRVAEYRLVITIDPEIR